jgi:hypothetical protein
MVELDDLGIAESADNALPVRKAPAERGGRGALDIHEQLPVHAARHVERVAQAGRHDRDAVAAPYAVGQHHLEGLVDYTCSTGAP